MPSSRPLNSVALLLAFGTCSTTAAAQQAPQAAQGFALERLYTSAPGGGWFVMDALDMRGSLGGAMALTTGYAHSPLRIPGSSLPVVSDQAFVGFGFAATYDRFRLYLDMSAPLVTTGQSGAVGDYQFSAPSDGLGSTPDSLSDGRLGVDARILGGPRSPFRLGIGAQLLFPTGKRTDYDSDGTWRSMLRILAAGDVGHLTYAGQLGVHIRPLDDAPTPGSPAGSELLFGAAVGSRFRVGKSSAIVVGPEVFGASAFSSLFGSTKTEVEGLFTGRLEGTRDDGPQLRLKVGTGAGLDAQFGAPEWRVLFGIEIFDHRSDRDHDGIMDSKDACPDTPGVKADNPKTNGCRRYPPSSD